MCGPCTRLGGLLVLSLKLTRDISLLIALGPCAGHACIVVVLVTCRGVMAVEEGFQAKLCVMKVVEQSAVRPA